MNISALEDFSSESTIHGVRYFCDRKISKFFRLYWIFFFIFSLGGFCFYFKGLYFKWSHKPEYVTKTIWKPIHEIPFPAFTVCSPLFARNDLANLNKFLHEFDEHGKILDRNLLNKLIKCFRFQKHHATRQGNCLSLGCSPFL